MKITQEFAMWNRKAIANTIIKEMKLKFLEEFTTIHNYIQDSVEILDIIKPVHNFKAKE